MEVDRNIEKLISIKIIQEDAESIFSLLSSEHDSIFCMQIMPYYALFVQSCQEFMGEELLPEESAIRIKNIRNYLKAFADGFGKTQKKIAVVDSKQNTEYQNMLKFSFMKDWNIHYNLGTYWTQDKHVVGNTQQIAACFGIESMTDPRLKCVMTDTGYQVGLFVRSIKDGFSESLTPRSIDRQVTNVCIEHYCDLNTNSVKGFFVNQSEKEISLFYLNILCNLNFVKDILHPLFSLGNTWVFRAEYIVTYYANRALERLKNYCENFRYIDVNTKDIESILCKGNLLFKSKFRNCMMHYGLEDQGVLTAEHLDKPFYGLVENCFDGMDFATYLKKLHSFSNEFILFLEKQFDFSCITLKRL